MTLNYNIDGYIRNRKKSVSICFVHFWVCDWTNWRVGYGWFRLCQLCNLCNYLCIVLVLIFFCKFQATNHATRKSWKTAWITWMQLTKNSSSWPKIAAPSWRNLANCGSSTGTWLMRRDGSKRRKPSCLPPTLAMIWHLYSCWLANTRCVSVCRCLTQTFSGFPQSWKVREKFVVMESHGKVMENKKYIKSHGKVKILPCFAFKIQSQQW